MSSTGMEETSPVGGTSATSTLSHYRESEPSPATELVGHSLSPKKATLSRLW